MVRDDFIALCAVTLAFAGGFSFGWAVFPETAELELAKVRTNLAPPIPRRTLPPDPKAIRCMMVWIGSRGPELWCPAAPPLPEDRQASPAVPTS